MKYNIINDEKGFRIEGVDDNLNVYFDQTFNSFTGNPFTNEQECIDYCNTLGYINTPVIEIPDEITINNLKESKVKEIEMLYNNEILKGFNSSANGTDKHYSYGTGAQDAFQKLFLLKANNALQYPTDIYTSTGDTISLSESQLQQLLLDIEVWEYTLEKKLHSLLQDISLSTDIDSIQNIKW